MTIAIDDTETQWTHKTVKEALVQAFITCERTTGRIGPRAPKAAWVTVYDLNDIWEQRRTGTNEYGRGAKPQITAAQIQESDAILLGSRDMPAWLTMLGETPERVALELWAIHELHKAQGRQWRSISELCIRLGWSKATFDRRVSRGAYLIAQRLNSPTMPRTLQK